MAFIGSAKEGKAHNAGYFLAHEECTRETREIPTSLATAEESGAKYVKMGTVFPSNDANAIGIVYEDVDVSVGNMPGSVVTRGEVIENRLPVEVAEGAKSALEAKGIKFVTESTITRPNWTND